MSHDSTFPAVGQLSPGPRRNAISNRVRRPRRDEPDPQWEGYADGLPVPFENEWHRSTAYRMLKPGKGHSGLWQPQWVQKCSRDPNARRLVDFVLYMFDDKSTRSAAVKRNRLKQADPQEIRDMPADFVNGRIQHCRARAMRMLEFQIGFPGSREIETVIRRVRTLDKPLAKLFAAAGIASMKTGRRVLKELVDGDVFFRRDGVGSQGTLIFPNGHTLACAVAKQHGYSGPPASLELELGWYESDDRREAVNRDGRIHYNVNTLDLEYYHATGVVQPRGDRRPVARGTWIDDLLYAACELQAGPAEVAADILWWCDGRFVHPLDPDSHWISRAKIQHLGRRWVARSEPKAMKRYGYGHTTIDQWLDWLVDEKRFFDRLRLKLPHWNTSRKGVCCYSPNPAVLAEALQAARPVAARLRYQRFAGFKDQAPSYEEHLASQSEEVAGS